MASFGENLKAIRLARGMSQDEFAELLGTSKQVISRYENSQRSPKITIAAKYANILGVSLTMLNGELEPTIQHPDLIPVRPTRLPLLGPVAAGKPIQVAPEDMDYVDLPYLPDKKADACLIVKGDSMIPKFLDGDIVFIRFQDDVEDGQIAAICIDDTVTLKRVHHIPNGVMLVSENSEKYSPMTYTLDEVDNIHLIGLAVGFMRWEH